MHVAGADRPNQPSTAVVAQRERQKDMAPVRSLADAKKARFRIRVREIRKYVQHACEQSLHLGQGHAVLLALFPIARVPLEAVNVVEHAER